MNVRRGGFSLLEMLAVVLLTSVVIGVALNHYVSMSRAIERASEHTRGVRRAAALLDRVARDLESTEFHKPPEGEDPFNNSYVFIGLSRRGELGADRLKFVSRGRRLRASEGHESDQELVVYCLREDLEAGYQLMRWSSPRLPESWDDSMPCEEDEGARLLADGLADFGLRFIDSAGQPQSEWDAAQLLDADEIPLAVDILVAMADDDAEYRRRVLLPVPALDMEELLDPASLVSGGSGEEAQGEQTDADGNGEPDDEDDRITCRETPCAQMTACQVLSCRENIGRWNTSIDTMLKDEMSLQRPYCSWRASMGLNRTMVDLLVENTACR